jgi:hypothetical protein
LKRDLWDFEDYLLAKSKSFNESVTLSIASRQITFQASSETVDSIKIQSGHLQVDEVEADMVRVVETSDETPRIPFIISKHFEVLPGVTYWFSSGHPVLLIEFHRSSNIFLLHRPDANLRHADLLRLVYLWLAHEDATPIHGGTVAWQGKCAMISNVGGSGKSSLITAAVALGATTTGEDFGLLTQSGNPTQFFAESQFQTFKLETTSPSLPLLGLSNPLSTESCKSIYSFNQIRPNSVAPRQRIDLVLIPRFGNKTRIETAKFEDAVSAVGISSASLALNKIRAVKAISRLCSVVPIYFIDLTPNSYVNSEFVKELLVT